MNRKPYQNYEFTLDDFRAQLIQVLSPGMLGRLMRMLPGMKQIDQITRDANTESDAHRLIGIIDSMTPTERSSTRTFERSRIHRIAKGAGVRTQEVSQLLKKFNILNRVFDQMGPET